MSGRGEGRSRRRRLGPDERQLWDRVAATASPLHRRRTSEHPLTPLSSGAGLDHHTPPNIPATPTPTPAAGGAGDAPGADLPRRQQKPAPRSPRGLSSISLVPPDTGPVGRAEAGLDRRTAQRLRKGGRQPDARVDLHGMTAERAHRVCLNVLAGAVERGDRVVLVITGKGRGGDATDGRGVLRQALPGWLRASPLGHSIVGIYQAHRRHGGAGAFYVYLKKRR